LVQIGLAGSVRPPLAFEILQDFRELGTGGDQVVPAQYLPGVHHQPRANLRFTQFGEGGVAARSGEVRQVCPAASTSAGA
jgi:hypothetical protein